MKINSGSNEACPHTQRIHQPRGCGFNSHLPILSPCLLPANPVNGYGWILGDSSSGRARGIWGYSSVGRTSALQAEGQGFESPYFHHAVADRPGSPDHPGAKPYHVCAKAGVDHAAKRMLLLQPESDAGQLPA